MDNFSCQDCAVITIQQYFGPHWESPDVTEERKANAERLLALCERLESIAVADGVEFPDNPATGSGVSGVTFGGFRPQNCPQGAPHSAHKEGMAVDRYDPHGLIDAYLMANQHLLTECGIFIEHPDSTPGWSHWSNRAPGSGHHVFYP